MSSFSLPPFFAGKPLPELPQILSGLRVLRLPMRVKFRGVTEREVALLEGPAGWGEFSPFLEYDSQESAPWLASALEAAWLGFPQPLRHEILLNATVPAVPANRVEQVLANYSGEIREVKVKVAEKGQTLADDIARVRAVRQLLPQAGIKVDANAGWQENQAVEALSQLAEFELLYAEQPVASLKGLTQVRQSLRSRGITIPIAADESVRKAEDPLRVAELGAADVLIVKAAPLGGVRRAAAIVEQAGLPAVVSSALESSVGIRAGLALAACLPQLPYGCGLATVSLLEADSVVDSLLAQDGVLEVREVCPDESLLAAHGVAADRYQWWVERITACYKNLQTS